MAGTYQGSTMGSARRLALAYLLILSAASLSSALPANKKPGVLDDIVYVSDDPAVKKWRQELSGAGIYPAHYALKALDLLPLPDTPSRLIKIRRRRRDREIGFTTEEPRASEGRARTPFRTRGLERRRRKKEKAGHDENGYDDGSWRGNNGDYGSEKYYSNSEYGQEENGYDDARHSSGSQKYEGSEASWYDRGQESDTVDYQSTDAQDGNDDASQSYFQPDKAKNKYKPYKSTDSNNFPEAGEADGWRAPGSSGGDGESERTTASDVRNDGSFTSMTPTAKTYDSEGRQNDDYGEDRDYTSSREASSSSDCATLKRFYEDMGGSGWIDNTGWTSSGDTRTSCCRAFGVSCNMDGHVTALDLGSNGLTGPLSTAVFELRYLSRLNLTTNAISAELPDKFDSLPRLTTVYLDQNSLKGSLPTTFKQSYSISSVHISNNTLEGPLSFPNARNLTQLYAARNRFTDLDLSANKALIKVALDDNQFNCTLPDIESFSNLQVFSVARNYFTGPPPVGSGLQNLVKLDLQVNQLSGTFPDVAGLPRLQYLGLNGNSDLSGPFPTGKAPPNLVTCHVDTLLASSCPAQSVLDDPESLAARCSISCRGGGKPSNATDNAANAGDSTQDEDSMSQNATTAKSRTDSLNQQAQTPASLAESLSSGQTRRLSSSVALIAGVISLFTLF